MSSVPSRVLALAAVVALGALAGSGCGKRGSPLPPEPSGPLPAGDVRVRQIGTDLVVALGVPPRRGDRPAQDVVAVELVAVEFPPGTEISDQPDVFGRRGRVVLRWPEAGTDAATLEPGRRVFLRDPIVNAAGDRRVGWTLRYAVRVEDRRGRRSVLASTASIVPVAPLAVPADLVAEAVAQGIELRWAPVGGEARYQVYRAEGDGPLDEDPRNPAPLSETSFVDERVVLGVAYRYVVRTVDESDGPRREGASSAPATVVAEDRFAPEAPERLVVVQEGPFVRLFWDPGVERDLAGYEVERAVGEQDWAPVATSGPVLDPRYLDRDVAVGQRIRYRVFAVDVARPPNRSEPSDEVVIVVAPDPGRGER